ncbi:MAG: NUDIX domain-containing protein, partial [Bacteroidota bacterium]|nr:NUDIX domain-containing protein [Bacteroidota bacterium]
MTNLISEPHYSGKLRVRVCGICFHLNKILLIRHKPFAHNTEGLWSPPGGGLQYGESMKEALIREFKEETGLGIEVNEFLFIHEFISLPLHA